MSVVIEKIPSAMWIDNSNVSFKVFAEKFVDYMQDIEDIENVEREIKNNSESFDYNLIRNNYV